MSLIKKEFVKPETDLDNVTFTPSKFGVFMITAWGMGLGFGLMSTLASYYWLIGLFTFIISLIGLLWSYSTRVKY